MDTQEISEKLMKGEISEDMARSLFIRCGLTAAQANLEIDIANGNVDPKDIFDGTSPY